MNRRPWRVWGRARDGPESSRSRRRRLDVVAVLRRQQRHPPMPRFPLGEGGRRHTRGPAHVADSRRPARQQITQKVTLTTRRTRRLDAMRCSIVRLVASRAATWADGMHNQDLAPNDPCKFRGSFQIPRCLEWHGMPPAHCMALTSEAAPSRRACSECPVHASFTLNTTTPEKSFCSARPLGCVSTAQCRSERSTALLLLAPEDN